MAIDSRYHLRSAYASDLYRIMKIKDALQIDRGRVDRNREGFLLGSTPEFYLAMVAQGVAKVIEDKKTKAIYGIGFALPWDMLKLTEIWQKRTSVDWQGDILTSLENGKPGYIEQLAVLPGQRLRFLAPGLGLSLIDELFGSGHTHILATTVLEPVKNIAALKLLKLIEALPVGEIDEYYPEVGKILSQVHCVSWNDYKDVRATGGLQGRILNYLDRTSLKRQGHVSANRIS